MPPLAPPKPAWKEEIETELAASEAGPDTPPVPPAAEGPAAVEESAAEAPAVGESEVPPLAAEAAEPEAGSGDTPEKSK
jgi:hypothetical protein